MGTGEPRDLKDHRWFSPTLEKSPNWGPGREAGAWVIGGKGQKKRRVQLMVPTQVEVKLGPSEGMLGPCSLDMGNTVYGEPTTWASALSVACRLLPLTTGAQSPPQVARCDVDKLLVTNGI